MLYDSHIHFIPQKIGIYTSFYQGIWQDKHKLFDFLEENKIEKALLTYPATDAHKKLRGQEEVSMIYNAEIETLAKENGKIIPCAILNIDDIPYIPHQIEDLYDRDFKVVSLPSSYNSKFIMTRMTTVFEALAKRGMNVFVHPQTESPIGFERVQDPLLMPVVEYSFDSTMCLGLLMMEGIIERFSGIKFIFSSLGGVAPFLKDRFDRVYPMLKSRGMVKELGKLPSEIFKKVYVDTSGSSISNIRLAIDLFGSDKILWGSDYPVNPDIKENLSMLDSLSPTIKEKITSKNFLAIFPDK